GLGQHLLARLRRHVGDVFAGQRDVLAAQPEPLDDHVLRDAAQGRDLGGGHLAAWQVTRRSGDPHGHASPRGSVRRIRETMPPGRNMIRTTKSTPSTNIGSLSGPLTVEPRSPSRWLRYV